MWAIPQATVGETSQGTWIRWQGVPEQVWHSTDTIISRKRDHSKTERDRTEVETLGEGSDVCEGAREGTKDCSADDGQGAEEKDGESEIVRKQLHHGREGQMSLLRGDGS